MVLDLGFCYQKITDRSACVLCLGKDFLSNTLNLPTVSQCERLVSEGKHQVCLHQLG